MTIDKYIIALVMTMAITALPFIVGFKFTIGAYFACGLLYYIVLQPVRFFMVKPIFLRAVVAWLPALWFDEVLWWCLSGGENHGE